MNTDSQPTNPEMRRALWLCFQLEDIPGARTEAVMELRRLRHLRSTWYDTDENALRREIDAFLDAHGGV